MKRDTRHRDEPRVRKTPINNDQTSQNEVEERSESRPAMNSRRWYFIEITEF